MAQLIETTGDASLRIIKAAISGLYSEEQGKAVKNTFKEIFNLLFISVERGLRNSREVILEIDTWVKTCESGLFLNIHCNFCGDITWTPPKAIQELDSKKMEHLLIGVGQILHALTDLTTCLLRFNYARSALRSQLVEAVTRIQFLDLEETNSPAQIIILVGGNKPYPSLN